MMEKGHVIADDGAEYPEGTGTRCVIVGIGVPCLFRGLTLNSLPDGFLHSSFGIAFFPVKDDHNLKLKSVTR